jgi:hypothetical protein
MFRTRDFLLVLVTVAFLVIAISFTVVERSNSYDASDTIPQLATEEIEQVFATVTETDSSTLTREERLAQLREKIQSSEAVISSPTLEAEELVSNEPIPATSSSQAMEVRICSEYESFYQPYWPVASIEQQVGEGVRQYAVPREIVSTGTSSASSTEKHVLLVLSQQFLPTGSKRCLPSDVVGVALDGSLIRNNEVGLYSIFTDESLIGYALDGFPMYGQSDNELDECGGRIALGQYRYEIQADSDTLINCFSGQPQKFIP